MNLFSVIGVILFLTQAQANDLDILKQCQVSCSASCRAVALKLKPLIEDAEGCVRQYGSGEAGATCIGG